MFSSPTSAVPCADGALGFGIKEDQITALTRDHNYSGLQQYGGVS
jgi:P-type Ca2+ transporter type 2C